MHNCLLQNLPEPEASYDVVTLIEVLEHVPDPLRLRGEIHHFLRPGGCLYLTTPNARSLMVRLQGISPLLRPPDHLWIWSSGALRKLLIKVGFQPLKIWTSGLNLYHLFGKLSSKEELSVRAARTEELRDLAARRPLWQFLKFLVSRFLEATALGDTLKVLALKNP